jgi:hypothetical protein
VIGVTTGPPPSPAPAPEPSQLSAAAVAARRGEYLLKELAALDEEVAELTKTMPEAAAVVGPLFPVHPIHERGLKKKKKNSTSSSSSSSTSTSTSTTPFRFTHCAHFLNGMLGCDVLPHEFKTADVLQKKEEEEEEEEVLSAGEMEEALDSFRSNAQNVLVFGLARRLAAWRPSVVLIDDAQFLDACKEEEDKLS